MNNKGFAATGILYTLLMLFILLIMGILTMFYSRNGLLTKIKNDIKTEIAGTNEFKINVNFNIYSNDEEISPANDIVAPDNREFSQYVDLAPYFDEYGVDQTYHLELDLKSEDTTNYDKIRIYFQNGSSSRYKITEDPIETVSTEWKHVSFDFNVFLSRQTDTQAMLAFYGTYGTGNKPVVKNVRLSLANSQKQVTYGTNYGTLPTPKRAGYRFLGWNGKNMLDYNSAGYYARATQKVTINNELVYQKVNTYTDGIWPIFSTNAGTIRFVNGQKYTISFDIWSDTPATIAKTFYVNNVTRANHNISSINSTKQRLYSIFTYSNIGNLGSEILHIYPKIGSDNNIYISNVLVESGEFATEYEPYYITDTTKVVQAYDHTLTAIWEPIS